MKTAIKGKKQKPGKRETSRPLDEPKKGKFHNWEAK